MRKLRKGTLVNIALTAVALACTIVGNYIPFDLAVRNGVEVVRILHGGRDITAEERDQP